MGIDKWEKWVSIATNVGVLVGIVLLVIELQQNNDQLAAQARYAQFENQSYDFNRAIFQNADLASILTKSVNQEPLTEVEERVLNSHSLQLVRDFEFEFMESRRGLIDPGQIDLDRWAGIFNSNPRLLNIWETRNEIWQDEFRLALNEALARAR